MKSKMDINFNENNLLVWKRTILILYRSIVDKLLITNTRNAIRDTLNLQNEEEVNYISIMSYSKYELALTFYLAYVPKNKIMIITKTSKPFYKFKEQVLNDNDIDKISKDTYIKIYLYLKQNKLLDINMKWYDKYYDLLFRQQ